MVPMCFNSMVCYWKHVGVLVKLTTKWSLVKVSWFLHLLLPNLSGSTKAKNEVRGTKAVQ